MSTTPNAPTAAEQIGNEKENAVIQRARDEVNRLCVGRGGTTKSGMAGRHWTMSIPVRSDDSDEIFAALVDLAVGLQVALLAARREVQAKELHRVLPNESYFESVEPVHIGDRIAWIGTDGIRYVGLVFNKQGEYTQSVVMGMAEPFQTYIAHNPHLRVALAATQEER